PPLLLYQAVFGRSHPSATFLPSALARCRARLEARFQGERKLEVRRHHPDYRVALVIECKSLICQGSILSEAALPKRSTYDYNLIVSRSILVGGKGATYQRLRTE